MITEQTQELMTEAEVTTLAQKLATFAQELTPREQTWLHGMAHRAVLGTAEDVAGFQQQQGVKRPATHQQVVQQTQGTAAFTALLWGLGAGVICTVTGGVPCLVAGGSAAVVGGVAALSTMLEAE